MSLLPVILCALLLLAVALVELRATYADALERGTPPWPRVPWAMIMAIVGAGIAMVMERYGIRPPDWELWTIAVFGALVLGCFAAEQARRERRFKKIGGWRDTAIWLLDLNQSGREPRKGK